MERIKLLDSFRFIAILMVLLFHYYSRWNGIHYQIEGDLLGFKYGYLGVEFFFMISGYVIYFTLTKTENFQKFLKSLRALR